MNHCLNCNKETDNPKFCSRPCNTKFLGRTINRKWSFEDESRLCSAKGLTKPEIIALFPGKTWKAIHEKAKKLKIRKLTKRVPWDTGLTKETNEKVRLIGEKISELRNNGSEKAALWAERSKESIRRGFKNGRKSWLKDLTKETDERVKKLSKKSTETRVSNILSGKTNPPTSNAFKGSGFRKDLQKYFRSSWEANTARILDYLGVKYEFESKRCRFETPYGNLILDFYLPELDMYLEVKGYLYDECYKKLKWFINNVKVNTKIIDYEVYLKLADRFMPNILLWEK